MATEAEVAAALTTELTIDITTIGARTHTPRRIEIWFLNIDDRIFITGTPRPRDWLANLTANPAFTFHLKGSVVADLAATARVVADPETRAMVIDHPKAEWYRGQASREDLIDGAPMVEVTF